MVINEGCKITTNLCSIDSRKVINFLKEPFESEGVLPDKIDEGARRKIWRTLLNNLRSGIRPNFSGSHILSLMATAKIGRLTRRNVIYKAKRKLILIPGYS